MGNKLAASEQQRDSSSNRFFFKPKRSSPRSIRHLVSPSSPSLHQPKHKRRSRSQSEGVTSDCGTAVSTTDSQLPRGSGCSDKAVGGMGLALQLDPTTEEEELSKVSKSSTDSSRSKEVMSEHAADQARRVREAEKILLEIAKEYAAKRAAGLVPTKPVPARTLLWEEMERRAQRARAGVGRRGTCVFGRDSDEGPCGCTSYKKIKKLPDGKENTGGVCECCDHGAPWHRLAGGTMTATGSGTASIKSSVRSSLRSRGNRSRTSSRNSHAASRSGSAPQQTPIDASTYSLGSDYYDEYADEYDSDEDESDDDDEDIANEVARPYGMMDDPAPPLMHSHARSEGDALDRSSLFSNGDSFGLPPRLSSTSRHLDKLLGAIAKYRAMGLSEDEIEIKIRGDFPPTERISYGGHSPRPSRASR